MKTQDNANEKILQDNAPLTMCVCGNNGFRTDPNGKVWCYQCLCRVTTKSQRKKAGITFKQYAKEATLRTAKK